MSFLQYNFKAFLQLFSQALICPLSLLLLVFKEKDRNRHTKKEQEEAQLSQQQQPVFIPVVGANDEPELKPTTQPLDDVSLKKRKSELAQMPTDNYHFDRFKKKAKSFR